MRSLLLVMLVLCALGCQVEVAEEPPIVVQSKPQALVVQNTKHQSWYHTAPFAKAAILKELLATLSAAGTEIVDMTSSPSGAWVITTGSSYYWGGSLPADLRSALDGYVNQKQTIVAVDINAENGWVLVGESGYLTGGLVPAGLKQTLDGYLAKGWGIRSVELGVSGFVVLGSGSRVSYSNLGAGLEAFLYDRRRSGRRVQQVDIGFDGRWVAVAGQEPAWAGISDQLKDVLGARARQEDHVSQLMLGPGDAFVVHSHGKVSPTPGDVMEALEYGFAGANLWQRIQKSGLPGLSIAVIDDNQVVATRSYGVLREGEDTHVLASTPFDLASLSKYLGALTLLKLAFDPAFDLDLNASIVDSAAPGSRVDLWLENGGDPAAVAAFGMPGSPDISSALTPAHLLRHQTDFYPSGGSPGFDSEWPHFGVIHTQILMLGFDCGASGLGACGYNGNNFAWTTQGAGPVAPVYDSVNFLVAQAVAEDAAAASAEDMLQAFFFGPMGLHDISGGVAAGGVPDPAFLERTAWQHSENGPAANRTVYPWVFAGGVHGSAADYARLLILALNEGKDEDAVERVDPSGINLMLTGVADSSGDGFGMGVRTEDGTSATESSGGTFFHDGRHFGRTRAWMCGNPQRDEGIVILMNGHIGDGSDLDSVDDVDEFINALLNRFTSAMSWSGSDCR